MALEPPLGTEQAAPGLVQCQCSINTGMQRDRPERKPSATTLAATGTKALSALLFLDPWGAEREMACRARDAKPEVRGRGRRSLA